MSKFSCRRRLRIVVLIAGALFWTACAGLETPSAPGATSANETTDDGEKTPFYAWVQQGDGTSASARAIVSAEEDCPMVRVDGDDQTMTERGPAPENFEEIKVCEFVLSSASPPGTLSIRDVDLPPPTRASQRIFVLGDTGCRQKKGNHQKCTGDPDQGGWGLPEIAAAAVATTPGPDLLMHVGDYHYREEGCSDCGYRWLAWEDDFFEVAAETGLLTSAPWLFIRGNHEDCTRAWTGYSLFFAEAPWSSTCDDHYPVSGTCTACASS